MIKYKGVEVSIKSLADSALGVWDGDGEPQMRDKVEIDLGEYGMWAGEIVNVWDIHISEKTIENLEQPVWEYISELEGQRYFRVYN